MFSRKALLLVFISGFVIPSISFSEPWIASVHTDVEYDGTRTLRVSESIVFQSPPGEESDEARLRFTRPFLLFHPTPERTVSWFNWSKPKRPAEPEFDVVFHAMTLNGRAMRWTPYAFNEIKKVMINREDAAKAPKEADGSRAYTLTYSLVDIVKRKDGVDEFSIAATGKWPVKTKRSVLTLKICSTISDDSLKVMGLVYDYEEMASRPDILPVVKKIEDSRRGTTTFTIELKQELDEHQTLLATARIPTL